MGVVIGVFFFAIVMCLASLSNAGLINKTSVTDFGERQTTRRVDDELVVPDCIQKGDLLLFDVGWDESNRWKRPGPYNEHCAIYIGNNSFIDAFPKGVHVKNYTHYHNWQKNLVFLRVKTANESQRQAVIDWALDQLGVPYQNFFLTLGLKIAHLRLPFFTAGKLYCMEFLWAAYYLQGIDIDRNGWHLPWWVTGNDIIYDDDIEIVYSEVNDSTEIIQPYKGVYIGDKKIVSFINGMNRSYLFGDIDIKVVTHNERITRVDFYINGEYIGNNTKPNNSTTTYSWPWKDHRPGKKVLTAVAWDDMGHQYSSFITVWRFF
jgi:cell wall-associated NlpC family hydrolase